MIGLTQHFYPIITLFSEGKGFFVERNQRGGIPRDHWMKTCCRSNHQRADPLPRAETVISKKIFGS